MAAMLLVLSPPVEATCCTSVKSRPWLNASDSGDARHDHGDCRGHNDAADDV